MPTHEQKLAMLEMLDRCDAEAWRATVAYCARELAAEQDLLAEIVCRRLSLKRSRSTLNQNTLTIIPPITLAQYCAQSG
jgi:hypothetical protein